MKKYIHYFFAILFAYNQLGSLSAQTAPVITSWLVNTSGLAGRHYTSGNSSPIVDTFQANVQWVKYSDNYVYVYANGVPGYIVGPFNNNPKIVAPQHRLYKIPRNPQPNTGTSTAVGPGKNGLFINGVPYFNAGDGRSYNNGNKWHNNAFIFENNGVDCSKGHPETTGSYHHHQNPSAFNVATVVNSAICNPYLADGLYVPDSNQHGPLIGYSFDGFPVYGAYGYADPQNMGSAIKRMKPSWQLRNITSRTTLPDGTSAVGPAIGAPIQNPGSVINAVLGAYKEDYEFVAGSGDLDEHNGRICKTPEYPAGIYCYFATIDQNGNSLYPYITGPTYYGVVETVNFQMGQTVVINEPVIDFIPVTEVKNSESENLNYTIYPNPSHDILVVQSSLARRETRRVKLMSLDGKVLQTELLHQGSTMCYLNTESLYKGIYLISIEGDSGKQVNRVIIGN